ncbi:hypothetical protein VPNG_02235 [Cytospora leucostoma]|uniref:Uncharacterized protein n=1 Tax=Cytospora leucostoma TaxID=1230097 RepID=A0A423XH01_9PEZI|nr:hypothetical protein VPNG_02235 [Cytospora leucostoma]
MEKDHPYWERLLRWTKPPDNNTPQSILKEKTITDNDGDDDDDGDDGLGLFSRPSDLFRRSSSFEEASTSSERSEIDAITRRSKVFPPPIGGPTLVQSRRVPERTSTPQTSRGPLLYHPINPPDTLIDPHGRRMAPHPDASAGSRRPQAIPIPGRNGNIPTYLSSPDSESSYSEVESSAAGESSTSLSKTQTRSIPLGAISQIGDKTLRFATTHTSGTGGEGDALRDRQDVDPLEMIWRKLMDKKDEVHNRRAEIRRARGKLSRARVDKDTADNAFMACIRPLLVHAPVHQSTINGVSLDQRFLRMQQTRDQCQTYEAVLEPLEEKLDQAEHQLDTLERQLIHELRTAPARHWESIGSGELPPLLDLDGTIDRTTFPPLGPVEAVRGFDTTTMPEVLLGIAPELDENYHPLYNQLLSAVGFLQLAQEHHNELLMRKQFIEEEQERLRLAEDQERGQRILSAQQKRLRLAQKHEQARMRLAEEQERKQRMLVQEQEMEESKLAEELLRNSGPLRTRQLRDEDLEFLRDFEVDERVAWEEVQRLRHKVEQFKQLCREQGVIPRNAPLHEVYSYEREYEDDISIDFDPEAGSGAAEYLASSRFPLLLSNPSHLMGDTPMTAKSALKHATAIPDNHPRKLQVFGAAAKEFFIENLIRDAKENDKPDFINRWLLHKLRISPLEAELLYSCFFMESHLRILDLDRWQQDVLYYWPRDDAAKIRPEDFLGPVTPVDTQLRVGGSEVLPGTRTSQRDDPHIEHTVVSL